MRIIYENEDKSIVILIPTEEAVSICTIEDIAEKDVPTGLPYWIVDASTIPSDRTFRGAWEIGDSLGEPHGFGGLSNEFDEELKAKWLEALNGSN